MLRLLGKGTSLSARRTGAALGTGQSTRAPIGGSMAGRMSGTLWPGLEGGDGSPRPPVLGGYSHGGFLGLLALSPTEALLAGRGIIMWPVTWLHGFLSHARRALTEGREERRQGMTEQSPME